MGVVPPQASSPSAAATTSWTPPASCPAPRTMSTRRFSRPSRHLRSTSRRRCPRRGSPGRPRRMARRRKWTRPPATALAIRKLVLARFVRARTVRRHPGTLRSRSRLGGRSLPRSPLTGCGGASSAPVRHPLLLPSCQHYPSSSSQHYQNNNQNHR